MQSSLAGPVRTIVTGMRFDHAELISFRNGVESFGRSGFLRRVRSGELVKVGRGFYASSEPPEGLADRLWRLQATTNADLVACGPTAAELHGLPWISDPRLHVTTLTGEPVDLLGPVVQRQKVPRRAVRIEGILATDPAETVIDLARAARPAAVLQYLDAGLCSGVSERELWDAAGAAFGARGIVAVREWLPWAISLAESPPESWLRQRLIAAGLHDVEAQIEVRTSSRVRRLDLGWRKYKVGCEYDGEEFHTGDGSLDRDRRRSGEFQEIDWSLVHVTRSDLKALDRPVQRLRKLLLARGWEPPPGDTPPWPSGRRGSTIPE